MLVTLLLSACSSNPTVNNEYLLMDEAKSSSEANNSVHADIQLLPIKMAPYLAGYEIVLVSKQGEVHRSQQNLWAEPLAAQLHRLTLQRLSTQLPNINWFSEAPSRSSAQKQLNIEVNEFFADLEGLTHISGRWQLFSSQGELLASSDFSESIKLSEAGYPTLVQAFADSWFNKVVVNIADQVSVALTQK